MKTGTVVLIAGVVLLLLFSGNATAAASAAILDDGTTFNFAALSAQYGADNVNRLAKLYMAMQGNGLTRLQTTLMLSQSLFETGLFTDNPNYNNMDRLNNYAGITANSRYSAGAGSIYAAYPNLNEFVQDWLLILNYNTQPINASGVSDFVQRLKTNGYFAESIQIYQNGVQAYYNLLTGITNNA